MAGVFEMRIYTGREYQKGHPDSGLWTRLFRSVMVVALFLGFSVGLLADDKRIIRTPGRATTAETPADSSQAVTLGKGDLYALVIGVARYKVMPEHNLKVSDNDAKQFAAFLETQRQVFRHVYVKTLVNEEATKLEIEKYLYGDINKAGKNDTVIVFLSGHGVGGYGKTGDYFFLGNDADLKHIEATSIKMNGAGFLKGLDAPRVLVIADCCHAAGIEDVPTKSITKGLDEFAQQFSESSGRVFLCSSKPDQPSQEIPGGANSVFTHYLLKGLNGEADTDRNGIVTLTEVWEYVYEQTKNHTVGKQLPELKGSVSGRFPISVLGKFDDSIKLEALFVAQDPRCTNKQCTDPPDEKTVCNDPLCGDVEIKDGDAMYSGQNYQIGVRPSTNCYVYVYHIGAKGDIYRLFPDSDFISPENKIANPLTGGEIYWVPAKDAWLQQDDQVGREKIYVVASRCRNQALEDLYAHLETLRKDDQTGAVQIAQKRLETFMQRTMAPTKTIKRKAESSTALDRKVRSFEELSRIFESLTLDAVQTVSFDHRKR
jgi:hypothetical protein